MRAGKSQAMMLAALAMADAGKRVWYAGRERQGMLLPTAVQERWRATADRPALVTRKLPEVVCVIDDPEWRFYDEEGP